MLSFIRVPCIGEKERVILLLSSVAIEAKEDAARSIRRSRTDHFERIPTGGAAHGARAFCLSKTKSDKITFSKSYFLPLILLDSCAKKHSYLIKNITSLRPQGRPSHLHIFTQSVFRLIAPKGSAAKVQIFTQSVFRLIAPKGSAAKFKRLNSTGGWIAEQGCG